MSWENNLRILRIKNVEFSGYCFYTKTKMLGDFQICISEPLKNPYIFSKKNPYVSGGNLHNLKNKKPHSEEISYIFP